MSVMQRLAHRIRRISGRPRPDGTYGELTERMMVYQSSVEELRRSHEPSPGSLHELEYRLFSQFGDDGIIAFLARFVPSEHRTFVEFGVEDYRESNTRLLLQRDNWRGLVLDGCQNNIDRIQQSYYYWKHEISATCSFITSENINASLQSASFAHTIGILSVDIDGVDYWIWQAIDCIKPLIVICEYNAIFGPTAAVTVPYDPSFDRNRKHSSGLYAGASLAALVQLANGKGLRFIGCNSAGNNAYFVHSSLNVPLPELSAIDGYVESRFREARNASGMLTLKTATQSIGSIAHMPVVNLNDGKTLTIKEAVLEQL